MFRLTNGPGGLGLSCTAAGLSLAGVPLLQKTGAGFVPRPAPEINALIKSAYGTDPTELRASLEGIAEALNRGDLACATIAAIQTRTPELSFEAAARLAAAENKLIKYDFNPDEPRDWHGDWTREGGGLPNMHAPAGRVRPVQVADASVPHLSDVEQDDGLFKPPDLSDDGVDDDDSRAPASLEEAFERKYDGLGPTEFAKQVIEFGDLLGRQGSDLSPAEKEHALAEYSFLQDRLSFWLDYDFKPPKAQANLLSAALTLYQGAINGGVVGIGQLPRSMLDVAGASGWTSDSAPPRIRPLLAPNIEEPPPIARLRPPAELEGPGGAADKSTVDMTWDGGIKDQGIPFEIYIRKQDAALKQLPPNSKTFDHVNETT
ncbi:MAG TPA: hypothetical protein VG271_19450, partial [Beijerinckiaceae bacterium]|nr:hypothetical protein [Beijerinckiaceae bacterium]